jgi:hypothetical protein
MSTLSTFDSMLDYLRLRRALARRGLAPASSIPDASGGRTEQAAIQPATLVEDTRLEWHAVGAAEAWPGLVAFLDGTQHLELLAYAGATPLFGAEVAAAVRERRERRLATAVLERRSLVIGRAAALEAAGDALEGVAVIALPEDGPPHPVRDTLEAGRALDRARGALEVAVGTGYRTRSDAWLVADGSIAESPGWAADRRMVGVVKSHAALPFEGPDLERYLRLPCGHRSSVFQPRSRSLAPVHAWALRLWPWEGKDLFHGLVRVEVAPATATPDAADGLSRWLLAERAPLSTPDPRWDRLLYGIYGVEQFLRATKARSVNRER